ncbi:type II toxin-antitoxin system prevent-host-death family antitoxin [Mesorhizobium sp. CU2]|uniref:type II toxin-antitoxin system prevent-host-death family antitoxin n=1 Tax=unclassified Mesorhizobium TaxID=325217 RepID=UPI0011278438|nr:MULTISPECIES: type II toxin-antitoxin system prevent-host-death family antitoxin [unclassified Mesorhizobium]TPN80995.1 type II toxin-antitoxin system prevent-host-death family antitoxin [Mesorhizobium sp. CU3]TPO11525.1 type II toxin-antitoxin system prevent-host-death family antitoxin [Mesorhizobium sp. CU2]
MRTFTTDDLGRRTGDVLDAASAEPVVLISDERLRLVLMSIECYERMRAVGDPRHVSRTAEMPEKHKELFAAKIDRLARGEGYDGES